MRDRFSSLLLPAAEAQPVFREDFELTNSYQYVSPTFNPSLPREQWPLWPEGRYTIAGSPNSVHPLFAAFPDHTTGSGKMYIVNGVANTVVWARVISGLTVGHSYAVRLWAATAYPLNPARLRISIPGGATGPEIPAHLHRRLGASRPLVHRLGTAGLYRSEGPGAKRRRQ
jgi:hypothetical protein